MEQENTAFSLDPSIYKILLIVCTLVILIASWFVKKLLKGLNDTTSSYIATTTDEDNTDVSSLSSRLVRNNARSQPYISQSETSDTEQANSKKLGVKKQRKLEMKAEKKVQREREMLEREEKKKQEEKLEKLKLLEEENARKLKEKIELEEKLKMEEIKRKEQEEYNSWKQHFTIEDEGYNEQADLSETSKMFQEFLDYIKTNKIVLLEDLASRFKLKVKDIIERLEQLIKDGIIDGVFDDRGKFVYVTRDELLAVAKFIEQQGRISITDLVQHSNRLLHLNAS